MAVENEAKKSISFKFSSNSTGNKLSNKEKRKHFAEDGSKEKEDKDYILSAEGKELKR